MTNSIRLPYFATNFLLFMLLFPFGSYAGEQLEVNFQSLMEPLNIQERLSTRASSSIVINGVEHETKWNVLIKNGQKIGKETFGLIKDIKGKPLKDDDGNPIICEGSQYGSGPDHTTILQKFGKLFMVTQFECSPGTAYLSELEQNPKTGALKIKKTKHISFADVYGGYVHCGGTPTPWQSHLGSEEYNPDARLYDPKTGELSSTSYFNTSGQYFGNQLNSHPYYYGWIPEITIKSPEGRTEVVKHYGMGRASHEFAKIMPDLQTIYITDDDERGGLYLYITDKRGDLTSGTLYAARWEQLNDKNGGEADLTWISLGHSTNKRILEFVKTRPAFYDMFETANPLEEGKCPKGFKSINAVTRHECLKVKSGMEEYASRLEKRRYSAIMGATTEFRKEEGFVYDPVNNKAYLAISKITDGMTDENEEEIGGPNHIRLEKNKCGAVYELDIETSATDSKGKAIDSNFVLTKMKGFLVGEEKKQMSKRFVVKFENKCDTDKIAGPDNLGFIEEMNTLIIGEDSSGHKNNFVWAYNKSDKSLTRIMSVPLGAEATSPHWYQNINGWSYLIAIAQHPEGATVATSASILGYWGPIPANQ